jgi:hypothetical protein
MLFRVATFTKSLKITQVVVSPFGNGCYVVNVEWLIGRPAILALIPVSLKHLLPSFIPVIRVFAGSHCYFHRTVSTPISNLFTEYIS